MNQKIKIAVCVKQIPDTTKVEIDPETQTLRREGVESILNPLDAFAVEQALRIKEKLGGATTAFSMGPPQAENMLREVMAFGIDHARLICGKEFAGSDTWATSLALARTLEETGPWDVVICGKQAVDGDTAHVGPEIAAHLDLHQITFVKDIHEITPYFLVVERLTETGSEVLKTPLPALLTVLKDLNEPRWPNLKNLYRARFSDVRRFTGDDLGLRRNQIGLEGSPTRVVEMFSPKTERGGKLFEENYHEGIELLVKQLKYDGVLT